MIQSLSFTSAAFEVFAGAYLCFLVSASAKKMPRIKFLGTSKNMSPRIKYIFVWKKKAMFRTSRIFSWFHNADHLLYYSQMSVFSFHTSFVLLYQFLRNRTYNWQKFNNKMNEKKKLGVSEYGHPGYVTRQINSRLLDLLLSDIIVWFLHRLENLNML